MTAKKTFIFDANYEALLKAQRVVRQQAKEGQEEAVKGERELQREKKKTAEVQSRGTKQAVQAERELQRERSKARAAETAAERHQFHKNALVKAEIELRKESHRLAELVARGELKIAKANREKNVAINAYAAVVFEANRAAGIGADKFLQVKKLLHDGAANARSMAGAIDGGNKRLDEFIRKIGKIPKAAMQGKNELEQLADKARREVGRMGRAKDVRLGRVESAAAAGEIDALERQRRVVAELKRHWMELEAAQEAYRRDGSLTEKAMHDVSTATTKAAQTFGKAQAQLAKLERQAETAKSELKTLAAIQKTHAAGVGLIHDQEAAGDITALERQRKLVRELEQYWRALKTAQAEYVQSGRLTEEQMGRVGKATSKAAQDLVNARTKLERLENQSRETVNELHRLEKALRQHDEAKARIARAVAMGGSRIDHVEVQRRQLAELERHLRSLIALQARYQKSGTLSAQAMQRLGNATAKTANDVTKARYALERMERQQKRMGESAKSLVERMSALRLSLWGLMTAMPGIHLVTSGLRRAFGGLLRETSEWETQLGQVHTLVPVTAKEIDALKRKIADLAKGIAKPTEDITRGLYYVISSGVRDTSDAMLVLEASTQIAAAGLAGTEQTVDALTTVLNAYNLEASEAQRVTDLFFRTVEQGKLTFSDVADNLGIVTATAAQAKVPLEELLASLAALTAQGIRAPEATISLERLISAIVKPTPDVAAAAKRMGVEWNAAALAGQGLFGVMGQVREAAGGSAEKLNEIFNAVRIRRAGFPTVERFEKFLDILATMEDSSGAVYRALAKMNETLEDQYQMVKNRLLVAWEPFGNFVLQLRNWLLSALVPLERIEEIVMRLRRLGGDPKPLTASGERIRLLRESQALAGSSHLPTLRDELAAASAEQDRLVDAAAAKAKQLADYEYLWGLEIERNHAVRERQLQLQDELEDALKAAETHEEDVLHLAMRRVEVWEQLSDLAKELEGEVGPTGPAMLEPVSDVPIEHAVTRPEFAGWRKVAREVLVDIDGIGVRLEDLTAEALALVDNIRQAHIDLKRKPGDEGLKEALVEANNELARLMATMEPHQRVFWQEIADAVLVYARNTGFSVEEVEKLNARMRHTVKLADDLADAKRFKKMADALGEVAKGLGRVLEGFDLLDKKTRRQIDGLAKIADGLSEIQVLRASGADTGLAVAGQVATIAGIAAGIVGSLVRMSDEDKALQEERQRRTRELIEALDKLRETIRSDINPNEVRGHIRNVMGARTGTVAGPSGGPYTRGMEVMSDPEARKSFEALLDLLEKQTGVAWRENVLGDGWLSEPEIDMVLNAAAEMAEGLSVFDDTLTGHLQGLAYVFGVIGDAGLSAAEKMERFLAVIERFSPEAAAMLRGLSPEEQRKLFAKWAELIAGGPSDALDAVLSALNLTAGELRAIIDQGMGLAGATAPASRSVQIARSITEIQAVEVIAWLEQIALTLRDIHAVLSGRGALERLGRVGMTVPATVVPAVRSSSAELAGTALNQSTVHKSVNVGNLYLRGRLTPDEFREMWVEAGEDFIRNGYWPDGEGSPFAI